MTDWEEYSVGIGCLPDELIYLIFKFLPYETLLVCEKVSSRWRKLARISTLWKHCIVKFCRKVKINSERLEAIDSHGQLFTQLWFERIINYQDIKTILTKCSNVISIQLKMCSLDKEFEENVKNWPNLKKLNLKNSTLYAYKDLDINYGQLKELRYLSLSNFGLSPQNCKSLLQCPYLNDIRIGRIKHLNSDFIKELIISKRDTLTSFSMYGGKGINDEVIQLISQCPLLRRLGIKRSVNVTDRGLMSLVNLKNILYLQIGCNKNFSEKCLVKTFSSCNLIKLNTLSLSKITNFSPAIIDIISKYYKGLKFIAIYDCPLIIRPEYKEELKYKLRNIAVVRV